MGIETPDILKRVDRTPDMMAAVRNVSAMPAGDDGKSAAGRPPRMGETFASVLNRSVLSKGAGADLPETINGRKLAAEGNDNEMKPGEGVIGYLNRRHQVTVNDHRLNAKEMAATEKAVAGRAAPGTVGTSRRAGESDAEFLNRSKEVDPVADKHTEAEKAAEGLVANALILPVLKQLRRSTLSENSVFSGGNGEKAFGPEFDMQLADRIARSPRLAVKNALVERLEHRPTPVSKYNSGLKANPTRIDVNG